MTSGYVAELSFGQRQIRFLELLRPGESSFALPLVLEITGPTDERALLGALQAVVDGNDVLRASFPIVDGEPVQAVRDTMAVEVDTIDVPDGAADSWQDALSSVAKEVASRPFDLVRGPLVRACLLRLTSHRLGLVVVLHHIIADGPSLQIFARELVAEYDAAQAGASREGGDGTLQYPDYADWERERFNRTDAPELEQALKYWRARLQDVPAVLDLPFDRRRQSDGETLSEQVTLALDPTIGNRLTETSRRLGATEFVTFLAVLFAVLRRWSALDDLVVTIPVSKRGRPELEDLIGLFVDTFPIRALIEPGQSFASLVDSIRRTFLESLQHSDVPFERIVQAIGIERRSDVIPLMQILFGAFERNVELPVAADGSRFSILEQSVGQTAKTDLSVVYRRDDQGFDVWCRYNAALFDRSTIEGLLTWYAKIATAVADDPNVAIDEIPLIEEAAGRSLIAVFNATTRPYPRDRTAIDLFYEVAHASPQAVAVDDDGEERTYAEVAASARRLATVLAEQGIEAGEPIILAMPLSSAFIDVMLATLTIGATYVPIDPTYPRAHLDLLIDSIGARRAIALDADLDLAAETVLSVEEICDRAREAAPHPGLAVGAEDPAYIMFTSGSTGVPKGVAVPHRAIVRLVRNTDFCHFGRETRAAAYSNPSFDASTLEVWAPLLNGGTVVPADRTTIMNAGALRDFLSMHRITLVWITAGLFQQIATDDPGAFAGARTVITGGDVFSPTAARAVLASCSGDGFRLLDGYGPTENTTFSTVFDIGTLTPEDLSVPIGRPIANSTVYILDPVGQPLPVGVVGEIHVGGDGVALGYVGDPERTSRSFLIDPFAAQPDSRMYRTGDLGRWRADGTVQLVGRADDQVKVRGFRIELNEVTNALSQHPNVAAACVIAPRQKGGERHLIAYVVPKGDPVPGPGELRAHLQSVVPGHMLPHAYMILDRLPLTINGKVDRAALPPVEEHHYDRSDERVAPRTDEERVLANIWGDLLGLTEVSVRDNFFRVGGDSILAIRMVARACETGLSITLKDVFEHQTIEGMAAIAAADPERRVAGTGDHFHPIDLAPSAVDAPAPFSLVSLDLTHPTGSVEVGIAIQRLALRHDALRLRVVADGVSRRLVVADFVGNIPVRIAEVSGLTPEEQDDWVSGNADRLSRGLDLTAGVAIVATLINRPPALEPIVVLALHRAVADDRAVAALAAELELELRDGPASRHLRQPEVKLDDWLTWLEAYPDTEMARSVIGALESEAAPSGNSPFGEAKGGTGTAAQFWLPAELARDLTDTLPTRLGVSPQDAFLAALGKALNHEGPGGDLVVEVIDAHRPLPEGAPAAETTLGNLEAVVPVHLSGAVATVEERLRAVKLARQRAEPIGLIYRMLQGVYDLPIGKVGFAWRPARQSQSSLRLFTSPNFGPSVEGALVAGIVDGRLNLQWIGVEPIAGAVTVLQRVGDELAAIVALASHADAPLYTPADFPLAGLSSGQLDLILEKDGDIADIYPLSPMQESMLLHSLTSTASEVNFEQSCMRFVGRLDVAAFRQAWASVFERHPALRTVFRWRGLERPLQVVRRNLALPFAVERWSEFDDGRLEARLAADRALGFDLENGPLARLTLIQVAPDRAYFITSFHHLLVDGWCLAKLEWEVRAAYEAFRAKRPPMLETVASYRDYIAWLARVDRDQARRYFAAQLSHAPQQRSIRPVRPSRGFATARLVLDRDLSRALTGLVRRRGVTIAALAHLGWGLWTAASRGRNDVVFCTTVSGRPPTVQGIDRIVGLLINNLPVRLSFGEVSSVDELLSGMQRQLGEVQSNAWISPLDVLDAADAADQRTGLFDTLVVVENVLPGTSAWAGAEGLTVEAVQTRLKTAYDLTFVVVPGEQIVLSLVLPDADGSAAAEGSAILADIAAILAAFPAAIDATVGDLPLPRNRREYEPLISARGEETGLLAQRPRTTLEAIVAEAVADFATVAVDLDSDFAALGLTSLEISGLASRLGKMLGRKVPVTVLLEHRTIASLAASLGSAQEWDAVVPMSGGTDEPFVCVHPIAGDVSAFLELARAMPKDVPLWALQAPGLESGQMPIDNVEDLAAANLAALSRRGRPAPKWIGGYSFGGIVAYEMARQLAARDATPERILIIDTPAPHEHASILDPDPSRAAAEWLFRMGQIRARYHGVAMPFGLEELLEREGPTRIAFAAERLRAAGLLPPAADAEWLDRAHRTGLTLYQAFLRYAPDKAILRDLPLGLIRASNQSATDLSELDTRYLQEPTMGWSEFVDGPILIETVEGDHVTILTGDRAIAVARAIADMLGANPSVGEERPSFSVRNRNVS